MPKASNRRNSVGDESAEPPECIWDVNENDVLNGRGVSCAQHSGNERFRVLVQSRYDPNYCTRYSLEDKKRLANEIVQIVKDSSPPGRFLKRPTTSKGKAKKSVTLHGPWELMTPEEAVKKARQALRDCNRPDREGYALSVAEEKARSVLSEQKEKVKKAKRHMAVEDGGSKEGSESSSDDEDSRDMAWNQYKSAHAANLYSIPPVSPDGAVTKAADDEEEKNGATKPASARALKVTRNDTNGNNNTSAKKRGRPPKKNGPAAKKARANTTEKEKDGVPTMVEAYPDEKKEDPNDPLRGCDSPQSAEWLRYWENHFSLRAEVDYEIRHLEYKVELASRSENVSLVKEAVEVQKYHLPLLKRLCEMKDKFPSLADMEEDLWSVQAELDATRGNVYTIERRYQLLERRDYLNRCWEEESKARRRLGLDIPPEGCWSSLVVQTQPEGHQKTTKKILF